MNLEREKEILVVNPEGKKGKKKKAKRKKAKKSASSAAPKKKKRKGGSGKKKSSTSSRRRRAKRNPGISVGGLLLAQAVGMASGIASQPAAKLAGAKLEEKGHPRWAKVARIGLPLAQSFGLGAGASALISPRVGQAVAAGGGAVSGLHLMSTVAQLTGKDGKQNALLTKAGFAMLSGDGLFERDGQVWRQTDDGQEVPLFAINNVTPYRLKLSNGSQMSVGHLGDHGQNHLVLNEEGKIMMLPLGSLGSYQESSQLSGYQPSERLSGLHSVG